jgi:hypothetical protein
VTAEAARKIDVEIANLLATTSNLNAATAKLNAETDKIRLEKALYPMIAASTITLAIVGAAKLFL